MTIQTEYYFESHITIDPVEGELLENLKTLVKDNGFRVAKLLMEKNNPSKLDSFMTAHNKNCEKLLSDTLATVRLLQDANYVVRRYKIENILLDIKL